MQSLRLCLRYVCSAFLQKENTEQHSKTKEKQKPGFDLVSRKMEICRVPSRGRDSRITSILPDGVVLPNTCKRPSHPSLSNPAFEAMEAIVYRASLIQYMASRFSLHEHWNTSRDDIAQLYRLACTFKFPPIYRRKVRPVDPKHATAISIGTHTIPFLMKGAESWLRVLDLHLKRDLELYP